MQSFLPYENKLPLPFYIKIFRSSNGELLEQITSSSQFLGEDSYRLDISCSAYLYEKLITKDKLIQVMPLNAATGRFLGIHDKPRAEQLKLLADYNNDFQKFVSAYLDAVKARLGNL
jgi:hypothetical protein